MRRPRFSSRRFPLEVLGITAAVGAIGAIVSWGAGSHWNIAFTSRLIAFAAFVAIGDLLEVQLDRRSVFALSLAPGLAFGLVRICPISHGKCLGPLPPLGEVVAAFILGSTASLLWRAMRGRGARLEVLGARLLVVLASAAVYRVILDAVPVRFTFGPAGISVPGLAAVFVLAVSFDVLLQSVLILAEEQLPIGKVVRDEIRATAPLLVSSVSVGTLMALAYQPLQVWTLPLFLAPLAATHYSFKQVATSRKNYLQTIRALAKVPEMAGYTETGHSVRVAGMSVEIAKELGFSAREINEVEYAALLHDIGRISIPDPEDAFKSTSNLQLALVGSSIIEETGHFPRVAAMVRDQHEPYRRPGEEANRSLVRGAKIIKAASAYDDATEPAGPGRTPWDALERLHMGMAYEFDPEVIQALTRVLERGGLI
ncbi:MAG: HD domain-containing protein [Actinobacteria bacterium]|nr:MAG: HD domain-containing protein [Actinomycetota bacterium]